VQFRLRLGLNGFWHRIQHVHGLVQPAQLFPRRWEHLAQGGPEPEGAVADGQLRIRLQATTLDPHAWLSPDNAAVWLDAIAAELSSADPDNAGTYFGNAAAAKEELASVSAEINATLEPMRGMSFVIFHDAYQYFETAFDFPASGAISLSDATDPSPARIAEIQGRVAEEGIECVLSEPQFNPGIVATVMDRTEANTAVLDPLGSDLEPGPDLYPQLLRNLATSLAGCL